MMTSIRVNIVSGKGLLADGTEPFITWPNDYLSLVESSDIHLRAISQIDTSAINHQN